MTLQPPDILGMTSPVDPRYLPQTRCVAQWERVPSSEVSSIYINLFGARQPPASSCLVSTRVMIVEEIMGAGLTTGEGYASTGPSPPM